MAVSPSLADDAESLVSRTLGEARFHTDGDILALAFSADGTLWSVEEPGTLRSWDESGRTRSRTALIDLETSWFFSPGAKLLAAACDELLIWDVASGKQVTRLEVPSWVTAVAFHPSKNLVATGHDDGIVRVWDPAREEPLAELTEHELPISALAFHSDGVRLASAGEDRAIKVWDINSLQLLNTLKGHTDRIPALAWQPGTDNLVSVGWDATARVWDVAKGEPMILLNAHDDQVLALAFTPDGATLATADSASIVRLWGDLIQAESLHRLAGFSEEIHGLAFRNDAARLAVGGTDRVIHVYDPATGQLVAGDAGDRRHSLAPWGSMVASTAGDHGLQMFDAAGKSVTSPIPDGRYRHVASSADGRWLAAVSDESFIQLWDQQNRKLTTVDGPKSAPRFLAFTPDSQSLSGAITNEGTVWMWNPETGEPALIVVEATEGCSVESIAWHSNGRWLLAGGVDFLSTSGSTGFVCVWDVPEKKRLVTIPHGATCLAFDRECRRFAYSGPDGWIGIHQTDDGEPLADIDSPEDQSISALVFTDDGNHIIAGGCDGLIRVWRIDSEELLTVRQFRSPIDDLLIRPDGMLLVAHQNGTVSELPVQRLTEDQ